MVYKSNSSTPGFSLRLNGIIGFIVMVAILALLFFVAKGVFTLLAYAAPVLILLALLINYKTIVNFLKFAWNLLRRNPLSGILLIVLSVIGFPILSGILFGKSILDRKISKLRQAHQAQREGEFVEYEEVIRPGNRNTVELPPLEKEKRAEPKENPYKDLF